MTNPPMKPSDEATPEQLDLAREAGEAYQRALATMIEKVADTGGLKEADDYLIGFAQEVAATPAT